MKSYREGLASAVVRFLESSVTKEKTLIVACPRCTKSTRYEEKNLFRPFCSRGCKDGDTIAWIDEEYRVAGREAEPEEVLAALKQEDAD
jgi:endogenous inhibitor of DNA gyrase (YacG/DUF329 family)